MKTKKQAVFQKPQYDKKNYRGWTILSGRTTAPMPRARGCAFKMRRATRTALQQSRIAPPPIFLGLCNGPPLTYKKNLSRCISSAHPPLRGKKQKHHAADYTTLCSLQSASLEILSPRFLGLKLHTIEEACDDRCEENRNTSKTF